MRRSLATTCTILAIAASTIPSAYAEDTNASPAATDKSADTAPATTTPAKATTPAKKSGIHFPVLKQSVNAAPATPVPAGPKPNLAARAASIVVGTIVGVPVAMVRQTKAEVVIATKELVDNSSNPWYLAAAAPLGALGGIVSGAFQGVLYAPYNAYKYSEQPFSAKTFSLPESK